MIAKPKAPKKTWRRHALLGILGLVFLGGAYTIYAIASDNTVQRKRVAEVLPLKLIPPPPPPPPKEEPPPPPPKVVEQRIEQPQEQPQDTPQEAEPPSSAADLGASQGPCTGACVGTSGRDPTYAPQTIGGGGGRGGFGRYANIMQDRISRRLQQDEKLSVSRFGATIRVWLTANGNIEKIEFSRTTGDGQLDTLIRQAIVTMPALPEAPPQEMPQPIIVRIGARPGIG